MDYKSGMLSLLRDERGNFAIAMALAATVIFLAAGLAVDYSKALGTKTRINNAVDAAALATARAISIGEISETGNAAKNYFKAVFAANVGDDSFDAATYTLRDFTIDRAKKTVSAVISVDESLTLTRVGSGRTQQTVASRSAANFGIGALEIAMVLDITGSMGRSKLENLKAGAKLGVDELLSANTGTDIHARISLIPYSSVVNAGPLAKYVYPDYNEPKSDAPVYDPALLRRTGVGYDVAAFQRPYLTSAGDDPMCERYSSRKNKRITKRKSKIHRAKLRYWTCPPPIARLPSDFVVNGDGSSIDDCATDRKAPKSGGRSYQYTDADPSHGMISRDSRIGRWCPAHALVPLSSNKAQLKAALSRLRSGGSTAGHIGLQWAWYTLSHNWAPYIDGTASDPGNLATNPELKKFIILMTDGKFNTAYADVKGRIDAAAKSVLHTGKLCSNIKAAGIKIFTIGYKTPDSADTMLTKCASPDQNGMTYSYEPNSAAELAETYQKIARLIRTIRLTQ
jgi:Flp pilus assembly protein TadG